jgi:branched-chain amino acid transport system permease protein
MSQWYSGNEVLLQTTLIYAFVALSFQVALRSGVFSFASIGFYGVGGYAAAYLTIRGMNGWLALVVAVVGCGVLAILFSLAISRLRAMYLALVTVAFTLIISVIATNGGSVTGGSVGLYGIPATIGTPTMFVMLVVAVLILRRLELSSVGRSFEVLRLNEDLARSVGINVGQRRRLIFCLSAVLGAIAGVLNVYVFTTINPQTASFGMITLGLTMAVLGGIARWPGALVGAVIVAWLPNVLGSLSDYEPIIYGVVVVVLVVFAPNGIVGTLDQLFRKLKNRRAAGRAAEPAAVDRAPIDDLSHVGGRTR